MVAVHLALFALSAIGAAVVAIAAVVGAVRHRPARTLMDRLILAVLVLVALAIASGLTLLVTGHSPTDPLHLLYAVAALVALPIARFAAPSISTARRPWLLVVGGLVLLGLLVRLVQTG